MLFSSLLRAAVWSLTASHAAALTIAGKPQQVIQSYKREVLQDIVTWDEHSLFIHGERVLFYSGEFHPFRLPVPGLWLDVFQKIRALGYNGVSAYFDWGLLEGKQGNFSAEGIFALEPFFEAATQAGIYILARPGAYINAEVSGGGFPGWMQRNPGLLRTRDPRFVNATKNYQTSITHIIAKAQITNGGPVILLQPENEYTSATDEVPEFPDPVYWQGIQDQYRADGIVVPFLSNDAHNDGHFAPGPPQRYNATIDIYGHDGYPLEFDCANPYTWPDDHIPRDYGEQHINQSISTPFSIVEFQGGSFDPWGGPGFDKCLALLGSEFERVFYKNDFSYGVTIFNIYMTYGGTNWGNLGHPGGYTSYDYGAVISEERLVNREKYSQAKLLANFLQASPAYLTAVYQNNTYANGSYTGNADLATTALLGNVTNFFVVRHAAFNTFNSTEYTITLPTSKGNITIPQLGGSLSLHGRDSKVYVTDYDVGGETLLYSTAEIFTWKKYGDKRVLVVYTGPDETNEMAFSTTSKVSVVEGQGVVVDTKDGAAVLQFPTSSDRRVVSVGDNLWVFIVDRASAYNYWTLESGYTPTISAPIVKAGYLLRNATVANGCLHLVGDLNATTTIEVIGGAPQPLSQLTFNGESIDFEQSETGIVTATVKYVVPDFKIPDLNSWKVIDNLPELQSDYDDSDWVTADLKYSNNTARNLTTSVSLYASDYGFHTGSLVYRGHFTATGAESAFFLTTQGGSAYGHSVWLNDKFVGSFAGADVFVNHSATYPLPKTKAGEKYVVTILIDHMGHDENFSAGEHEMKNPRGVLDYHLVGNEGADVQWKLTGNLGGEDYQDRTRGPLNEGGMYGERQGYHLPGAPISDWKASGGPAEGLTQPGVAFYATNLNLNMPVGYDIPLSFSFGNSTRAQSTANTTAVAYRAQIFVNGYQFGKYVHNIGPQDVFPVPEGIWNYRGTNYVAVSLWALESGGAKVEDFKLVAGPIIQSGYGMVELSPMPGWAERDGAY